VRLLGPEVFLPLVWVVGRAYFGVRLEGVQNVPLEGPLIIAPNHVTYADPPLIALGVRRPIYFMAWNRLFHVPLFGRLIRFLRAFPVETESVDPSAVREVVQLLKAGQAVMIFPEGGRSPDGRLQRFKPGAFRLACAHGAPILPVTIIGGHEAWPPQRAFPRPGRVTIVFHPPVVPPVGANPRQAAQELLRQVRAAMASRFPPHQQPLDVGE
jgi:1-acyl-sn-glycerol-3-phosphate acyltransferase